jgi:protein phosphatase
VNELVKGGSITKAQAEIHPQKNLITRALGGEEKILPDFYRLETKKKIYLFSAPTASTER